MTDEPPRPERFLGRDDVEHGERTFEIPAAEWDDADDGPAAFAGALVTDERGAVLLVRNQWSDGWMGPGGRVEPGETFEAAARREVREETGVECEIDRPLRVERQRFVHAGDPDRVHVGYLVAFSARATDPTLADDPGVDDEDIRDVGWFEELPEDLRNPAFLRRHC